MSDPCGWVSARGGESVASGRATRVRLPRVVTCVGGTGTDWRGMTAQRQKRPHEWRWLESDRTKVTLGVHSTTNQWTRTHWDGA